MAIDVLSSSSGTANSTSVSCTLPSGVVSGDLLVLFVGSSDNAATLIAANTLSDGSYTLLAHADDDSGLVSNYQEALDCWYKTAGSSESAPTATAAGDGALAFVFYRISGQHPSSAPASAIVRQSINPPSLTPAWGSDTVLWIAACGGRNGTAVSAYPTNFVDDQLNPQTTGGAGTSDQSVGVCTRTLKAGVMDPAAFTGPGGRIAAMTIAVRQAANANDGRFFTTTPYNTLLRM